MELIKMEKIRIAQIGITHEHAAGKMLALEQMPTVFEIAGYVDDLDLCKTPRYIDGVQKCFENHKSLSLDEVLNDPTIKAVTVEVPNNDLVPMTFQFAERGLGIHMDKPAGLDLELYKKLLDLCKAKNAPFQMGFMFRGNPAFQFCIKAIRQKWIGDLISLEADMDHGYGGEHYMHYISQFSGGLMYNLGCHMIDFVVSAMGRPEKVNGFLRSAPGDPAQAKTNCMAVLEYPNSYAVVSSCSRQTNKDSSRTIKIVGTNGTIIFSPVERFDGKPVVMELVINKDLGYPPGNHTIAFPVQKNRYTEQLYELAGVIRGERESSYSFEHDLLVHEVTLAAAGYIDWK